MVKDKHDQVKALTGVNNRNISFKLKKTGGMRITFQTPPKNLDEKMIATVLKDYKMLNCEILVRDDNGKTCRRLNIPLCCSNEY